MALTVSLHVRSAYGQTKKEYWFQTILTTIETLDSYFWQMHVLKRITFEPDF